MHKASQVRRVLLGLLEVLELRDSLAKQVCKETRDSLEYRVPMDLREQQDLSVHLVSPEIVDNQDRLVLLERPESRVVLA